MSRLLALGFLTLTLTGLGTMSLARSEPALAVDPDPVMCTGYPEPRIKLESQGWWPTGAHTGNPKPDAENNGRSEHIHIAICLPYDIPVSGTVRLDAVLQIHETQGAHVRVVRVQDRDNTMLSQNIGPQTVCAGTQCQFIHTWNVDTGSLSTGRHEMRFHAELERPDGARHLATTGWHLCIRSCSPNISQAVHYPETEARSIWSEPSGTDYGYNNARLRSPIPQSNGVYTPVSGTYCPHVRTLVGAGGRPVVRSFVSIDPRWHDYSVPGHPNGYPGLVLVDEPNAINREVCFDTRVLADGRHRLFMRGDGQADTGKQSGIYVVDFLVSNGGGGSPPPPPPPSPPAPPPPPAGLTISVKQPFEGQRVRSWIGLRTAVSDPSKVRSVDYVIDGRSWNPPLVGTAGPDFRKAWQSKTIANGAHTIVARATLNDGSILQSPVRNFRTANGTSDDTARTATGSQATVSASADVSVVSSLPARSLGNSPRLLVDSAPVARSYLRFDLRGVRKVTKATLRVYATTGSNAGFVVRSMTASRWSERTTWRNSPAPSGSGVASGAVKAGAWTLVDVTRFVRSGRLAGLVLTARSGAGMVFASSEAAAHRPQLLVETRAGR